MKKAPIPKNEVERIAALYSLKILDTAPENRFDDLTKKATEIFHAPISTLTLIDSNREWFKSCQGLGDKTEGDRAISFCGHAMLENEIMVIPDTLKDERFRDNPAVAGKPHIRFYAGVPIMSNSGQRLGVFCIKDTKPREFSKEDQDLLKTLAAWAELQVNAQDPKFSFKQFRRMLIATIVRMFYVPFFDRKKK